MDFDAASANGFDLPVTESRSGIDETSLRRRNRRYSLAPKHITAAKKIALLACRPGKPGPMERSAHSVGSSPRGTR
jgi:hypothetical protein